MDDILSIQYPRVTTLVELPFEIRLEIYRLILNRFHCVLIPCSFYCKIQVHVYSGTGVFPYPTGVLQLSKQISNEALDVLYGETRFTVETSSTDQHAFWGHITLENQRRMRRVMVIADKEYVDPGRPLASFVTVPIISTLRRLTVVLPQTLDDAARDETLRRFCKFVNEHGGKRLTVEFDLDGEVDLTGLFKECFTEVPWRTVETKDGDVIFQRK